MDCRSEIWKPVTGYEGLYEVSNTGYVRTAENKTTSSKRSKVRVWKQRLLKFKGKRNNGVRTDYRVSLWKDGVFQDQLVARLVAREFCNGYSPNLTVNHINGNHLDNRSENLEWCSRQENIQKGFSTGLYDSIQTKIRLIDEHYLYIDFDSMTDASNYLGRSHGYVSNALKHQRYIAQSKDGELFKIEVLAN